MAKSKRVYTVESLELLDGTEVEVRPLPIKRLRVAQDAINKALSGPEDEDDEADDNTEENLMSVFLDITQTVMQLNGGEKTAKFLGDDGRDTLEDTIDQDTLYEIVKVATGFDFLAMNERVQKMLDAGITR